MDTHSAHTEHDPCCNDCGYDRTADHEPVGKRLADAMRHNDRTRPRREMREDEERAEPIMRPPGARRTWHSVDGQLSAIA